MELADLLSEAELRSIWADPANRQDPEMGRYLMRPEDVNPDDIFSLSASLKEARAMGWAIPIDFSPFISLLISEMRLLLCTDDPKYKELRKRLVSKADRSQVAIVSMISATVGSHLGAAAGMAVPLVAVCLLTLLKVGKEAFCERARLLQKS